MPKNNAAADEDLESRFAPDGFGGDDDGPEFDEDEEFNLLEAKEFVFQPLPRGNYTASVMEIKYHPSQSSGKPCLYWTFGIQVEGDDGKMHTRRVFMNDSMAQDQLNKVRKHVSAVNPDYDLSKFKPSTANDDLKDCECVLKLDIEVYQGKKKNSVKEVLPAREAEGAFLPLR